MQTHEGGCHCGAVRYTAKLDLAQPVIVCNCSHCQIKGLMLSAAAAEDVAVTKGQDALVQYNFNTGKIDHHVCRVCGVQPFSRGEGLGGKAMAMVNVRTLDAVDPEALTQRAFDGRSR